MNEIFTSVNPEKKQRVINAALKEFAVHDYKSASTNRIVESAGIGKGMLFHYFNSKLELYEFLVEYCIELIEKHLEEIEQMPYDGDYIERYRAGSQIKLKAYLESPYAFDFLSNLYLHPDETPESECLKDFFYKLRHLRNKFYEDAEIQIDASRFRPDMPTERQIKYIKWLIDGYSHELLSKVNGRTLFSEMDFNAYWKEFDKCIDDMKLLFYT